jgi:signal transduction histidine kinase
MSGSGFRDLVIGKGTYISSWVDYKNALLRGHLIVVSILVGIVYLITDWLSNIQGNEPYYLAVIATSVITFILNRKRKYKLANILFLSLINLIIFLFAAGGSNQTGIYMLFIISGISGFALFGYKDKILAGMFALLAFILFFLSYWFNISIRPARVLTQEYIQINFAINFTMSLITGIALLYFLMEVNQSAEKELLAKNDLLAKTNRELDRFVYSASHDLRAPLSSLLGLVEVAHKTSDPTEVKQCLDLMRQRVNNLDGFIKEIIDFSRNTRQEVRQEQFALLLFIKEIVDDLKFAEGMEEIYVRFDIAPDLAIISDTTRLKVVLNNLIGNAFKYHDPQKEHPEVYIKAQVEGHMIRIDIEDNGLGIATEHQPKVFEMFYRASEKSQGSGLGLYIVQETLAKLKGTIQLRSASTKGSTFSVWLPN